MSSSRHNTQEAKDRTINDQQKEEKDDNNKYRANNNSWYEATIKSTSKLTPTVTGLTLHVGHQIANIGDKKDSNSKFKFLPGQWVDFYIPDIDKIGGYSITSIPSQLPLLELAVKSSRHPPAYWICSNGKDDSFVDHNSNNNNNVSSPSLSSSSTSIIGKKIKIRVGGNFVYDDGSSTTDVNQGEERKNSRSRSNTKRKVLFIAGGVGINPLYGMIRQLYCDRKEQQQHVEMLSSSRKEKVLGGAIADNIKVALLYSASTKDELLFINKLLSMQSEFPGNFKVYSYVTRHDHTKGIFNRSDDNNVEQNKAILAEDNNDINFSGRITKVGIIDAVQWLNSENNDDSDNESMLPTLSSVYICGPPGMAEEMTTLLLSLPSSESSRNNLLLSKERIHYEKRKMFNKSSDTAV